jgi:hypothetical protein
MAFSEIALKKQDVCNKKLPTKFRRNSKIFSTSVKINYSV